MIRAFKIAASLSQLLASNAAVGPLYCVTDRGILAGNARTNGAGFFRTSASGRQSLTNLLAAPGRASISVVSINDDGQIRAEGQSPIQRHRPLRHSQRVRASEMGNCGYWP